jgi:hypothetical protein
MSTLPPRARGAATAAAAVTQNIYKGANNKALFLGVMFRLVLLSALGLASAGYRFNHRLGSG